MIKSISKILEEAPIKSPYGSGKVPFKPADSLHSGKNAFPIQGSERRELQVMSVKNHKFTNENLRWILHAFKPWYRNFLILTILLSLVTIVSLTGAVYMRNLLDIAASSDRSSFTQTALRMLILVVLEVALSAVYNYFLNWTSNRVRQGIRHRMFSILINKNYPDIRKKHTGDWMNRIFSDVDEISGGATAFFPVMISILIRFTGVIVLLFRVSVYFVPIISAGLAGFIFSTLMMREPMKQRQREARNAQGLTKVYFMEVISQILVVKAFNHEDLAETESGNLLENEFRHNMRRQVLTVLKSLIQVAGTKIPYIAVVVYGASRVLQGHISYGSLAMAARLLSQIRDPISQFSGQVNNFPDYFVYAERLREIESYPDDPACPVKSDEEIQTWYNDRMSEIIFRNAAFSYDVENGAADKRKVFSDVNLRIPKKSVTAITGMTGSGKSTLFKLLMSLYPLDGGRKLLGTTDGGETELDASFRRLFAYVPQGSQLLTGSVREIVTFGNKIDMQNDTAIWDALEISCALEFVQKLPRGLDTEIKEKGSNLSEGQMQRLAIARAVFSGRPILLLDEATSSLDEETEWRVLGSLRAMTNRTILIVTHRPAALSICEQEIHIENGELLVKEPDRK